MMESTFLARTMAALTMISTPRSQFANLSTGSIARCPLRAAEKSRFASLCAQKRKSECQTRPRKYSLTTSALLRMACRERVLKAFSIAGGLLENADITDESPKSNGEMLNLSGSLRPARRHWASHGSSWRALSCGSNGGPGSDWGWFIVRQNGSIIFVIFREQRGDFPQLLSCLLQHFDLLT